MWSNSVSVAGVPFVTNAPCVWSCPEIPGLPYPDTSDYPQWIIGYQYMGGINEWTPNATPNQITGTHSPVKLSQSQPYWCLAADMVAKINHVWGGSEALIKNPQIDATYRYWPPHRSGNHRYPDGGNEIFMDCSASWCQVATMYKFTTWTADDTFWFYQKTTDITTTYQLEIVNSLKFNPPVDDK